MSTRLPNTRVVTYYSYTNGSNCDLNDEGTWFSTHSNAGSINELQHDLRGKPAVPSSFALAVKTPVAVPPGAPVQHDWLVDLPGGTLPPGRISVRVAPPAGR